MNAIKIFLAFFFLTGITSVISAQDIITKKNGDEIKSKVQEVGTDNVKYKKYGDNSGPVYTLSKSEIFMIKYENGDKDIFDETSNLKTQTVAPVQQLQQETQVLQPQNPITQPQTANKPVYRKAYVGLSIGGAFLTKSYSNVESGGFQFQFNFGYLFKENIGIATSMFGTSYTMTNYTDASIGLTGMVAGPLFSTATAAKDFEFDLRPAIGFASASVTIGNQSGSTKETAFVAAIGGSIRWNCSSRISLSANVDYYNATVSGVDLSSFGISTGVNYRF